MTTPIGSETSDKAPDLPPELQALQAKAAKIEAQAAPAPGEPGPDGQPVPVPVDYVQEARGLVDFALELFNDDHPCLNSIYTPAKCDRLSVALAPVMQKYDFNLAGFFEKWKEEIGLALVAVPLAKQTIRAIRAEKDSVPEVAKAPMQPIQASTDPTSLHTKA